MARSGRNDNPDLFDIGRADGPERKLVVDVEGFEGPLDVLLALARSQKVDLSRISILALADQYLAFVEDLRRTRLEVAADYLVMAAWLAYLKSRLLLPEAPADDEPSGEELAADLALRLRRLEAMRRVAGLMMGRDRLGVTTFARGAPEGLATTVRPVFDATLYDLFSAYADHARRAHGEPVRVSRRGVWSLSDAREILERFIGSLVDWTPIERLLMGDYAAGTRASVLASAFSASLELAREGRIELLQASPFGALMIRARAVPAGAGEGGSDG